MESKKKVLELSQNEQNNTFLESVAGPLRQLQQATPSGTSRSNIIGTDRSGTVIPSSRGFAQDQNITLTGYRQLGSNGAVQSSTDKDRQTHEPVIPKQLESWDQLSAEMKQPFEITHSAFLKDKGYTFIDVIGKGAYGAVWRVQHKTTAFKDGREVPITEMIACKVLSLNALRLQKLINVERSLNEALKCLTQESDIFNQLNHPNIVKRFEILHLTDIKKMFEQPLHCLMFMELMDDDLYQLIINSNMTRLTQEQTLMWLRQIVNGLWYLHDKNISHMDIKASNILYKNVKNSGTDSTQPNYLFKLTDFGISEKFQPNQSDVILGIRGTIGYQAPEMALGVTVQSKPTDIYSLGIVMALSIGGDCFTQQHILNCALTVGQEQQVGMTRKFARLLVMMTDDQPTARPDIQKIRDYLQSNFPDYYQAYQGVTRL